MVNEVVASVVDTDDVAIFVYCIAVLGTCTIFCATAPLAQTKKVAHVAVALM